jgi:PAS domain S-box-containing protein
MKPLCEALDLIQDISNTFDGSISIKNPKGKYFFVNENFLNSLGLKRDQIIGKTDLEIFSKENAERIQKFDLEAYEKKRPLYYENFLTINGKALDFFITKWVVFFTSSDEPFFLCCLTHSIKNKDKVLYFREKIESLFEEELVEC